MQERNRSHERTKEGKTMSESIVSDKMTRRTFLKATAATGAVAAVGDKLFGGPMSTLVKSAAAAPAATEDKWIMTACRECRWYDPVRVRVVNGVVVKIEGIPGEAMTRGTSCGRSQAAIMKLYNPWRVKAPMKRTNPEKGLGVDPQWVEITWDEALDEVASKLKPVLEENPLEFGISHGFGTLNTSVIEEAFGGCSDVEVGGHICGGGFHFNDHRTISDTTATVDYNYVDYVLMMGSNARGSGKGCASILRPFLAARDRGMKFVSVDPALSDQPRMATEWIPIRPATDQAFALAMLHTLVHELGLVDWEFLKLRSNGPYLIAPDGDYARSKTETYEDRNRLGQTFGKPLIWDAVDGKAKTFDDETIKDFALEGTYTVDGVECQPAFQMFKDFLKPYTPEWAEPITTIPATTIRRIAREWGEAAKIGATMTFYDHPDGPHTLPHRPVMAGIYKGAQGHYHATLICRAVGLLRLVVGAVDVVGSTKGKRIGLGNPAGPDGVKAVSSRWRYSFKFPQETISLANISVPSHGSKPYAAYSLQEPEEHYVDFHIKVRLLNYTNELKSKGNSGEAGVYALKAIPFHFAISYHFDEDTEMCDIVFPEPSWLERWDLRNPDIVRYEFDPAYQDRMVDYTVLMDPVVEPVYNTNQSSMDTLTELAVRMGMLDKWNEAINTTLELPDEYKLDPATKYEWKDVLDRQLKTTWGEEFGVEWFRANGPKGNPAKGIADWYGYTKSPKTRLPLYDEWQVWVARQLRADRKKAGLPERLVVAGREIDEFGELIPLPEWKGRGSLDEAAPEYDLYVINSADLYGSMCMAMENPWLHEFAVRFNPYVMGVWINSATAQKKGIKTGDRIKVTSQYGHTVEGEAVVTEAIHPECVGINGCYGSYSVSANPVAREGTHFNWLLSSDPAVGDPVSGNHELSPKVKIGKV
jgi:anaerobic selenocysteine-containing dehydrogenase